MYAANWNASCLALLISGGCDIEARDDEMRTAAMFAAKTGNAESLSLLIEARCVIDARCQNGWTPAMYAASSGREHCLAMLLAAGADPSAESSDGRKLLEHCKVGSLCWHIVHAAAEAKELADCSSQGSAKPIPARL
jgi:ankyrin repeat protein